MKKLLSILLAAMMLASFAACANEETGDKEETNKEETDKEDGKEDGKEDEKKDEKAVTDEEAIAEVVENYHDAVLSLDFGEALNYLSVNSEGYEALEEMKDVDFIELMTASLPEELKIPEIEEVISNYFVDAMDMMLGNAEYTIDDCVVDGDNAEVTVTALLPDTAVMTDGMAEAMEGMNEDMEAALVESLTEDEVAAMEEMSEEEVFEYLMSEKAPAIIETQLNNVLETMEEDLEMTETTSTYVLEKIDGNWFILEEK